MVFDIVDTLLLAGWIIPAILAAAYLLWLAGVRDPFILTCASLAIGGAVGWALNGMMGRKRRR